MALVAYSSSEHEDSEEEEVEIAQVNKVKGDLSSDGETKKPKLNVPPAKNVSDEDDDDDNEPKQGTLLLNLPQPKTMPAIEETTEDAIPSASRIPAKKNGTKIKIEAPKLLDDEDEDEAPVVKKAKPTNTLLAMLPQPKSQAPANTRFVPNSVAQKRKAPPSKSTSATDEDAFDEKLWNQLFKRKTKSVVTVRQEPPKPAVDLAPEVPTTTASKSNVSFREFVKSKSTIEVDVVRDVVIDGEGDVEQLKALTDPEYEKPNDEEEPVNSTCKKKHHITYLAQQARANEQDLKNQWAASKLNRFQTRAKYGF